MPLPHFGYNFHIGEEDDVRHTFYVKQINIHRDIDPIETKHCSISADIEWARVIIIKKWYKRNLVLNKLLNKNNQLIDDIEYLLKNKYTI